MNKQQLLKLADTNWVGNGELWLDPAGNDAELYNCTLQIKSDALFYTWIYEDKAIEGSIAFNNSGAVWADSWHQPEPTECTTVPDSWGLFTVSYSYATSPESSWGWSIKLSERPDGTVVLQMTNIAPWGEEGRAVRMVFTRVES